MAIIMGYSVLTSPPISDVSRAGEGGRATFGRFAEETTQPMTLLLAAVGAVVTALFELTVGPYVRIGEAQPHPVLVLGVVSTIAVGFEAGLVWAFVGGLALDVLIPERPLGSSAFALLLCIGGAYVLARSFARLRPLVPIGAVFVLSIGYSMILFVTFNALGTRIPVEDPLGSILPSAAYDAVLGMLVGPLTIAIHDRRMEQERVDW